MYNAAQKEAFMNYYRVAKSGKESMFVRAKQVFQRIEKFETEWEMDFCDQDNEAELQRVFDSVSYVSGGSINGQLTVLRDYCKWCKEEGIINSPSKFLNIKKQSNNKLAEKAVDSPISLQMHLNAILDPESKQTIHNVYRALFWLAFIGFTESEAFEITNDEVDLQHNVIRHNDLKFDMYLESIPSIKNCKELKAFIVENEIYSDKKSTRTRTAGDLLLRGIRRGPGKYINTELSRAQTKAILAKKVTKQLTYRSVWMSGIFYWMFRQEQMGFKPDFRGAAIRQIREGRLRRSKDEEFIFDPNDPSNHRYILTAIKGLKDDYKRWKEAFYGIKE